MPRVGMPVPGIDFLDEGVLLARKEQLDHTGAGVTGSISGTKAVADIPGGGGGVTDHGALTGLLDDDHPQYQKESEKAAASGYPSLDASTLVPVDQLGTGYDAGVVQFLKNDRAWATNTVPPAATSVTDETTEGITAAVGADTPYARQAHTHGTGAWRRRLYLDMTDHAGGAGPLTLASYTIPANLLGTNKGISVIGIFSMLGGDSKTIAIKLGATTLFSDAGTSINKGKLEALIFNITPTAQRNHILKNRGTYTDNSYSATTEDTTADLIIQFTGNSTNITQTMFLVELIP